MQCTNCQFENIPGLKACGRCGATLQLQTVEIDVHPPRAGKAARRIRRSFQPILRLREFVIDSRQRFADAVFREVPISDVPKWSLLWRMSIPGWAHWYVGQTTRAKVFFGIYFFLVLFAVVLVGSAIGNLMVGLAISCHASSILDLIVLESDSLWKRLISCTIVFAALFFVVYFPIRHILARTIYPFVINFDNDPLSKGDVLIVNRLGTPEIGDIVVYEVPPTQFNGVFRNHAANIRIEGLRVDRILAGPGQHVTWNSGKLIVDGAQLDLHPLNPHRFSGFLDLKVPADNWLIIPSTDAYVHEDLLGRLSLVGQNRIEGTVLYRSYPLTRIGDIASLNR